MVDAARRYAATRPNPEFVPLPKTWLNDGRWGDDVGQSKLTPDASQHDLEDAIASVRAEEEGGC
jgi:hypothetical protein